VAKKSIMTLSEAETARRRAATGLRNLGDAEAAEKFERMSAREYAADRGVEIIEGNPRSYRMAHKTQAEVIDDLRDQIQELESENEELQDRLDAAADAIAGEEEAEDESDLEEADDDADADDDDD
jgi:tripartite-type tricarboxylate transporter receptor subunit TctC